MDSGPQLVIKGALLASFIVGILCYTLAASFIDADALPLTSEPAIIENKAQDNSIESSVKFSDLGGVCEINTDFSPNILRWCETITLYATQNNLSPNLIAALILQESGGDPMAYSKSGAVGLMQVMPRDGLASQFMCVNGPCFASRPTINELQDPEFNIEYGINFLSSLISRYGNIREGLKAYGPMNVGYSYADKVLAIFQRYH
jgi:soluble lytic murein transglycosylase-like protein